MHKFIYFFPIVQEFISYFLYFGIAGVGSNAVTGGFAASRIND